MQSSTNQKSEPSFDGSTFINAILIILFICLLLFGSTDIEKLTDAPS